MKIALLGYGKMGKIIEVIAQNRGHEIVLRKNSSSSFSGLETADVAIEFSTPETAVSNISEALELGIPVVSGTTGWLADYHKMEALCQEKNTAFLYGSNFSLGVNLLFEINQFASKLIGRFPEYKIELKEIHHTQKLDAPSGTAISLANQVISNTRYDKWSLEPTQETDLKITAVREDAVPGTHYVTFSSNIDQLQISHIAFNREGFAHGAVLAAEFLQNKKGIYTMKDVLRLDDNVFP